MPLTNYPNGLSSFGIPLTGGSQPIMPRSVGNVYFVDQTSGNDALDGLSPDKPLATLSQAHSLMTANQDDVAVIFGSTANIAVREAATLAWSKDKCHIIGANSNNRVSQRVSIRATSGATVFTPLVNVTADGCTFANFHVFHGFANASSQIAWTDTGERNAYYNVHFGGMGAQLAADDAGSASLSIGSGGKGEHYFSNCIIGVDTVDRGAANASLILAGGTPRNMFEDCMFIARTDAATPLFVSIGVGGIDRYVTFKRCAFHNFTGGGGTTMTQAMSVNASAGGNVLLIDSWFLGVTDIETSASSLVFNSMPVVDTADGGLLVVNAPS